jgi:hypothetical protein
VDPKKHGTDSIVHTEYGRKSSNEAEGDEGLCHRRSVATNPLAVRRRSRFESHQQFGVILSYIILTVRFNVDTKARADATQG